MNKILNSFKTYNNYFDFFPILLNQNFSKVLLLFDFYRNKQVEIDSTSDSFVINVSPHLTFSENGLCKAIDSLIDQAVSLFPKFSNWVFSSDVSDSTFVKIQNFSLTEIMKLPSFVIFPQEVNKPLVTGVPDNLFSENYYLKSMKRINQSKTIEIVKEIDTNMDLTKFLNLLDFKEYDIEIYEKQNDEFLDMSGFILYRLFLINNTIVLF